MAEVSAWRSATQSELKRAVGAGKKLVLLLDGSGTSYSGLVKSIGPSYIELENGAHELTVYYARRPMRFQVLDLPDPQRFGVADAVLV